MNAEEMFDGKVTRAKYIVEHYIESGITTWIYIPEEKKEIKMSETNLEHYKEQLQAILLFNFSTPRAVLNLIRNNFGCQIKLEYGEHPTSAILEWMAQPYKEQILDDVERKYLSDVIRPFRKEVATISKFNTFDGSQYIYIEMKDRRGINLPTFSKGTMYKGMIEGMHYSLKELGL